MNPMLDLCFWCGAAPWKAFVVLHDVVFHMDTRRVPPFWIFGGNLDLFPTLPYMGEGAPYG